MVRRRLLARIHRLTINRLRAEIQPFPSPNFSDSCWPGNEWMLTTAPKDRRASKQYWSCSTVMSFRGGMGT